MREPRSGRKTLPGGGRTDQDIGCDCPVGTTASFYQWLLPAIPTELFFRKKEGGKEGGREKGEGGREREEREKKSTVRPYSHFPQQFGERSGVR